MAKAKTYRLWTWRVVSCGESVSAAAHFALRNREALFDSKEDAQREIGDEPDGLRVCSFLVRVVPPVKRKRRVKR